MVNKFLGHKYYADRMRIGKDMLNGKRPWMSIHKK